MHENSRSPSKWRCSAKGVHIHGWLLYSKLHSTFSDSGLPPASLLEGGFLAYSVRPRPWTASRLWLERNWAAVPVGPPQWALAVQRNRMATTIIRPSNRSSTASLLNDAAKKVVKFASDFNGPITCKEDKHKGMFQGVVAIRK